MQSKKVLFISQAAMIAAIYVVLTVAFAPISYGTMQVRISEALTILPLFTPAAVPGLFIGCMIANMIGGSILPDIIFGSLTTLAAAAISYKLRKHQYLVPLPPIILNTLVVPFILYYGYQVNLPIPLIMLGVGFGEVISCGILGIILIKVLSRYAGRIFSLNRKIH